MSLQWRLSDRAKGDLQRIISFSRDRFGARVAQAFGDGFLTLIERLARTPQMGRPRPEIGAGVRSFPFRSHIVFYRIKADVLEVAHIRHGARRDPRL